MLFCLKFTSLCSALVLCIFRISLAYRDSCVNTNTLQRIHHLSYTYVSHYSPIHRESSCSGSLNSDRVNKARIDWIVLYSKYVAISPSKYFEFCTYTGLPSTHLNQCRSSGTINDKDGPQYDICWSLRNHKASKSTTNYMNRW